jgi:hypothetical protein
MKEQRKQQAQQHEKTLSQQLLIETLEARLQEGKGEMGAGAVVVAQGVLEMERDEKALLQDQLRICLGSYSKVCIRHHLLVTFVEEARVFLAQLLGDIEFVRRLLDDARREGEQTSEPLIAMEEQYRAGSDDLRALLLQKQRELDFALDKQIELSAALSHLQAQGSGGGGGGTPVTSGESDALFKCQRKHRESQDRLAENERALAEAEEALEKAEEERIQSCRVQAALRKELEERSAQVENFKRELRISLVYA